MDTIDCWFCENDIVFDGSSYFEGREGKTYSLIRCPHCQYPNRIYWERSIDWFSSLPTEKDYMDNEVEDAENKQTDVKGGEG